MKAKDLVVHLTILIIAIVAFFTDAMILLWFAFGMSWFMAFNFDRMLENNMKELEEYYKAKINDGK